MKRRKYILNLFNDYVDTYKIDGNRMWIYTSYDRDKVIDVILNQLGGSYHKSCSYSTKGYIIWNEARIIIKSTKSTKSAGKFNELLCLNQIKKYINGVTKVVFVDDNENTKTLNNIVDAKYVIDQKDSGTRADIMLIDDNNRSHGISIKKDNFQIYGSCESYIGRTARQILDECVDQGHVCKALQDNGEYKISRNIAFEATLDEKRHIMFGTDKCIVIQKTFNLQSFQKIGNTLIIKVSKIHTSNDINLPPIYFCISNGTKRNLKGKLMDPGTRVQAVIKSRVKSEKVLHVVRSGRI